MHNLIIFGLILQITLQFYCSILALSARHKCNEKNCKFKNFNGFWYFASTAFALMGFRRITALLLQFDIRLIPSTALFDRLLLPLTITILLFMGLRGIVKYVSCQEKNILDLENNLNKLKKLSKTLGFL